MKKLILTLLIGGLMMAGTFAASAGSTTKTAVVYFSATGTTEKIKRRIENGTTYFNLYVNLGYR